MDKIDIFNKTQVKTNLPDVKIGDTVRVYQKIKEGEEERIQVFEGILIARKHGKGPSATITVRRLSFGTGIERIYPIHSPTIEKIEIVNRGRARRAKLYYLRRIKSKKEQLKKGVYIAEVSTSENTESSQEPAPEIQETTPREESTVEKTK